MARKKEAEKPPNHERWLVSYGDFVTLLFAVFVTLYAMGQVDKKKAAELVSSLRESFGYTSMATMPKRPSVLDNAPLVAIPTLKPVELIPGQGKNQPYQSRGRINASAQHAATIRAGLLAKISTIAPRSTDKLTVAVIQRGISISIKEAGFFEPGSADISREGCRLLDAVATELSQYANPIRVEGHTDDDAVAAGRFKSNWELSALRATSVVRFLVDQYLFDPENIAAVAFGQYHPLVPNDTPENHAKNRRVDIILLSKQPDDTSNTSPGATMFQQGTPPVAPPPGATR